ncbi:MAG: FxsA family protein [Verrucomicrobia bacterium]|nr:FxsA family protein [Verrucomicrobiota bacterium]MDA1086485.1 FxsA family protein [Verrucomicrobiota bacterium]
MPFGYLLFAFIVVPLVELWLLMRVGEFLGAGRTIMIVVVTGVVGAAAARRQGASMLSLIQADLASGQMPAPHMLDGLMILIGGLLLATPGLITDTIGFLLLIPLIRNEIRQWMRRKLEQKLKDGAVEVRFGPW